MFIKKETCKFIKKETLEKVFSSEFCEISKNTFLAGLFIKPGIQERGTERGECSHFSIPGNIRGDSGECSKRFQGMLLIIPGNFQEDSGECSRGFRGMFKKIPGNV